MSDLAKRLQGVRDESFTRMAFLLCEITVAEKQYVERYKELYKERLSGHLSDYALERNAGRITELSYVLIDIFGWTGARLRELEGQVWGKIEQEGGKEDE